MSNFTDLHSACQDAHIRYKTVRAALAAALIKHPGAANLSDVITSTQEIGLRATLHRLNTNNPVVVAGVEALVSASDSLSAAVTAREHHLLQMNPKHNRVFVDDGREFTVDTAKGQWIYTDDPDHPVPLDLRREKQLPYAVPGYTAAPKSPPTPDSTPPRKRSRKR